MAFVSADLYMSCNVSILVVIIGHLCYVVCTLQSSWQTPAYTPTQLVIVSDYGISIS